MEKSNFSSIRKIKTKIQNAYLQSKGNTMKWYIKREKRTEKINNNRPQAHFIISYGNSKVFTL